MLTIKNLKYILSLVFIILAISSQAQNSQLKTADSDFEKMAYPAAIRNYETYLKTAAVNSDNHKNALINLAFCYRKLQDFRNTERVYKDVFKAYDGKLPSEQYLYYAQALANNGKYRDSQKYYSKYGEQQKEDLRGGKFTVAYMDNSVFYKDSSLYKIDYLEAINSRASDFSPMYYEKGLVFVSARNEGVGIKRIFMQNETPFLDLFVFPDTSIFKSENQRIRALEQASLGSSGKSDFKTKNNQEGLPSEDENNGIEQFSNSINTKYHEGPVTFFKDNKSLIFTRNNYNKGRARRSNKGVNMLKLYMATKKGTKWGNISELPFNSDDYSTGHPALSPDNKKLYFVSDMSGGYGGTDIYVVDFKDGVWGSPVNLGRAVNTEGNEMFPYADELGNFYFASDGHAGLGGLDIFYMEFRNNLPFGEVENLGAPVNSNKDDFGIIAKGDRESGFFSSNRKRGYSDDNIYSFNKGCKQLNMYVYDAKTKMPLNNTELRMVKNGVNKQMYMTNSDGIAAICLETGRDFEFKAFKEGYEVGSINYGTMSRSLSLQQHIKIYLEPSERLLVKGKIVSELDQSPIADATVTLENQRDGSVATVVTGLDGKYTFQPVKDGKYIVTAVKENYAKNIEKIGKIRNKNKSNSIEQNFGMIGEGDVFKIDNIYYDFDKSDIRADARKEIDSRLLPILEKYPDVKIELRSHTDSRASEDYNIKLSDSRANQVVNYLIGKGINPNRLLARGYGETELVNDCDDSTKCSDSDHQKNRRTEFKILAVKDYYGYKK